MKTKLRIFCAGLALLAGVYSASAQVTNLGIAAAGRQSLLYWPAGSPTNNNYILQSTTNLDAPNWTTEKYPVPVTASTVSNTTPAKFFRLIYTNPPVGMVLIPAGSFLMGNSIGDGDIADANPTNVYVSAFFMDTNLMNLSVWQSVYTYAITFNGYGFDLSTFWDVVFEHYLSDFWGAIMTIGQFLLTYLTGMLLNPDFKLGILAFIFIKKTWHKSRSIINRFRR